MLFWSGGHLLQFIYTQILMVALLCLSEVWKGGKVLYYNIYEMLLSLNFVLAMFILLGHFNYDVSDGEFKGFFTQHMIYVGGLVPTIFILCLICEILQNRVKNIPKFVPASFAGSCFLFLYGGLIGAVISGVNVTIPAHYHGSIVGISIAFMGLGYLICFKKEIGDKIIHSNGAIGYLYNCIDIWQGTLSSKAAYLQICAITFGQFFPITGLALAGGYGALRKTPGEEVNLMAKIYMGMVGGGGLIAIIGGLMFVYICAKSLYQISILQPLKADSNQE
jgi:hypothetical protein